MGRKSEPVKPPAPPTETEIEAGALELPSESLEEQAKQKFAPSFFKALKKIAYYTAQVGLPLDEACTLVDLDFEEFQEARKMEPLIDKIIRMKELQYKKDMLHVVVQKARSGDEKLAQWLLEKKYPEEYGQKKKQTDDSGDILFEAIRFIRRNSDQNPLVQPAGGIPVIVKKSENKLLTERIDDILSTPLPVLPTQEMSDAQ